MLKKTPDFNEFKEFYSKVDYLVDLEDKSKHEQFLFKIFEPTLKIAATSINPFSDFTCENYETLTRLKKKWLEKDSKSQIP